MRKQHVLGCAAAAFLTGAVISAVHVSGQAVNTDVTPAPPANSGMGGAGAPAGGGAEAPQAGAGFRAIGAGHERDVVLGGKTYLFGTAAAGAGGGRGGRGARGLALPAGEEVVWSKESGPGNVTFENASSLNTTATFDKLGDYTIKVLSKLGDQTSTDSVLVHVQEAAPAKPLVSVATVDYSLDNPLWQARIKSHIVGWIPHCVEMIETPDLRNGGGGIDNFIDAAKKLKGENVTQAHRGYVFSNAWVHNIVESMSLALMVDAKGDKDILAAQDKMRGTLEKWIPIILAAQEPDGYIQTAHTLGMPAGGGRGAAAGAAPAGPRMWERWTAASRGNHEGYTAGYFLESAIAYYYMNKGQDMRLYNAAKKCADCWNDNIGPATEKRPDGTPKQVWFDGHQEMEKALVRFGRLVNDVEGQGKGDKYIKLAKFLLDSRAGGSEYDQSHVPVIRQYEAVGHAVRASYTYAGMSAVMADTSDIDYQSATLSLWDNIVNKKFYITGGLGSGETSEGFGPDYSLRNQAYAESCANCGGLFFQYNMNLAYQDAKYVSLYEDTIYNAILGDTDLKGTVLCYTNTLAGGNNRQPWQGCPCCVGNVPRALLSIPTWTYATGDNDLYVNLFVGSTMTVPKFMGTSVQMVQKTNYPFDGKVSITVNPKDAKHFALRVAIPDRQVSKLYTPDKAVTGLTSLAVNGAAVANVKMEKGYAVIERDWKAGDHIDLEVPMQ
ncbi:MAG TPA: beta-L-arabinofuranosidase domain-containing protein, partial [Phycisphaerae bacterium]|nr:beta-L-arabinofuranosidase domain-containing protein [Phycisphaerae bacterium]